VVDGFTFKYNITEVKGHMDYSSDQNKDGIITKNEWLKVCPCFDVEEWYNGINERRTEETKAGESEVEEQKKDGLDQLCSSTDSDSSNSSKDSKPGRKRRSKRSSSNSSAD